MCVCGSDTASTEPSGSGADNIESDNILTAGRVGTGASNVTGGSRWLWVERRKTVAHPVCDGSAARKLLKLWQGRSSIAEFLIDFFTAAPESGWPDQALLGVFLQVLNEQMKDRLASHDIPSSFEDLVGLSFRMD